MRRVRPARSLTEMYGGMPGSSPGWLPISSCRTPRAASSAPRMSRNSRMVVTWVSFTLRATVAALRIASAVICGKALSPGWAEQAARVRTARPGPSRVYGLPRPGTGVGALGVQSVCGDDRAGDVHPVKQRGEHGDLVGLGVHLHLP